MFNFHLLATIVFTVFLLAAPLEDGCNGNPPVEASVQRVIENTQEKKPVVSKEGEAGEEESDSEKNSGKSIPTKLLRPGGGSRLVEI